MKAIFAQHHIVNFSFNGIGSADWRTDWGKSDTLMRLNAEVSLALEAPNLCLGMLEQHYNVAPA